jgi:CRP/FNR family transcriptional regulator, dissimilatory nitrate respiration regulator
MDITTYLLKIFLFDSLSIDQLSLLLPSASLKKISKGELLFSEDQAASAFFVLISGLLKIYKLSAEGDEHILHIQKPNDLIAEAIIFDFQEYPAYCQALEDSELIRISKTEFLKLLNKHPEISFKIMQAYSHRLRQLVNKIEDLSLHDIKSRLANYLIQHSQDFAGKKVFNFAFSKKDLASLLGTIPETLSRTLHFMKQQHLIKEEKDKIIVLDVKGLRKEAGN